MAIDIFGPFNKVINQTTTDIIDSKLTTKTAEVVTTVVGISFNAVDEILKAVQDITKEETKEKDEDKE